jgi:nucleoside-diphosphate-sugar epimerase
MSDRARKVLVTGARGFIGRRCLTRLASRGFEVHAVSSTVASANTGKWHRCDLLEGTSVEKLIAEVRPTHLLHLAWIAKPGVFWASTENLAWLASGIRLVAAFYGAGGIRAVGAGSCAEYVESGTDCHEDRTAIAPGTLYGEAKAAMYFGLRAAARGRGTWAWARLFFPYGPGEPPGRFIPSVIDGLIQGAPVDCTHGAQVRDFIHVDDVADAFVALVAGEASGAYNVGTGCGMSLREVAAAIVAELGHGELLRFSKRQAPAYDPARIVADIGKIHHEHGWVPRVALAEGIHGTIEAKRRSAQGIT